MKNVVLIADRICDFKSETSHSRNLEYIEDNYFIPLYDTLCSISPCVYHYGSPNEFLDNIAKHENDIAFTIWSGQNSRNRKAIVQSICEGYNIPYIGADSYLQIISADKHLSKEICKPYGIFGAGDVLISNIEDAWLIKSLTFPIIIKPNLEGGSIGISQDNVVFSYEDAISLCKKILPHFSPLIAEEYLQGEEINICIAGINGSIDVFQAIRQQLWDKTFFTHEILGIEVKKVDASMRSTEVVTGTFPFKEKEKLISLFNSFGKAEIMRIDGRLFNDEFKLIELTPDCSFSKTTSISKAFLASGYTYHQMLKLLLENAIKAWESQNANR